MADLFPEVYAGGQSRATPAQLATTGFNPSMLPHQVIDDPSFKPMSSRQPSAPQAPQPPMPQGAMPVAYQQAMDVSGGGNLPVMPETTIQQTEYNPRLMQQQKEQIALEQDAARRQAEAQQAQAAIQSQGYAKLANDVEARMKDFQSAADEFKNAKIVDPRNEWGAAQKIGAALAMGLGAYAAAFSGGKNYAADIIESTIKRDLDMQEARINKLGVNAKNAEGALAQAYRKFGDMAQARSAVEMAAIAQLGEQARKQALASDSDNVKANADKLIAALEAKKFGVAAEAQKRVVSTTGKPVQRGVQGNEFQTPYGIAPSKDAANTVRQQAQEIDEARIGLASFKDVIDKYGSWNLVPGEKKGEYQGALLPVINAYRVSLNMGVLNPSEREKIESELKNKLSTKEAGAFISRMETMVNNREKALQRAYIVGGNGKKDDVAQQKARVEYTK